jgi:hypothetical protein
MSTIANFVFSVDMNTSIHLNACCVLGDTPIIKYFSSFANKSFHDYTTGGSIPPAAALILGNKLKFIPTPKRLLKQDNIDTTTNRIRCEIYLKVYFSGEDMENDKIKPLCICSEWIPDKDDIPEEVRQQISNFVDVVH